MVGTPEDYLGIAKPIRQQPPKVGEEKNPQPPLVGPQQDAGKPSQPPDNSAPLRDPCDFNAEPPHDDEFGGRQPLVRGRGRD